VQLVDLGLLQRDPEGQIFSITDHGFRVVDLLEKPTAPTKHELLSLLHQIRQIATSLPRDRAKAEQVRNVTLWPDGDSARVRTLAATFGMTAAQLAAEAHRHLMTVAESPRSVQQTPRQLGFELEQIRLGKMVVCT
jgi:hypothetical protein